ncbi:hypothetical protein ACTXJX_16755 [Glutamicibacter ardleyensis]|uniref:hypothetical protein n=1 Tax=Glutamicibacter ardleyensis TaxID=225894 RepID=UPI003FD1B6F8
MSAKRVRGASLVERGAVDTVLSDYEGNPEIGPFEQLMTLRIIARIGLSGEWQPIVVSHIAEEMDASRQRVRNAIEAVTSEFLDFDVQGNASGRGRRVNLARATTWLIERVQEVIDEEEN